MNTDQTQEEIRNRISGLQDDATEALHRADSYVRENPMPTILGALALGFVVGLLIRPTEPTPRSLWRDARDVSRGYADDAEDQLRSLLTSIAKKSKKAYKKSSSAVRDAIDEATDAARDLDVDDVADPVTSWFQKLWKKASR